MSEKNRRRQDDPDLIVVVETDVTEALMIAERLRSLDIPTVVKREAYWAIIFGSMARASVLVPRTYYERATDALA